MTELWEPAFQPSTLVELLSKRAVNQPDQQAYVFLLDGETEEASLTYAGLDRQARAIAARLQELDTAVERALLLYPPGLDYIAGFFGCLYAGVVAVPAYPPDPTQLERTLPRLEAIIRDAQPTVALTTSPIQSIAESTFSHREELQNIHWLATDTLSEDLVQEWQEPDVGRSTLAFLQYTSGSTASPQGVMLTHGNLLHNLALIHDCFGIMPGDRGLSWLPPYHDMGLVGGILEPLYMGESMVLMSPIDFLKRPFRWLQAISRYRANISGGPNFAYDLCVRKTTPEQRASLDLSCWRLAFNGAEPIRAQTLERFTQTFAATGFRRQAFYPCYGLAEATLIASGGSEAAAPVTRTVDRIALGQDRVESVSPSQAEAQTLVGCGQAPPGQQIAVIDPVTNNRCNSDQVGEIWLAGPSVAQGYWRRPQETQDTFRAYIADSGEGPFLRSGDLGFLDANGELFVTGRLKDLIIIHGQNHYPQDIEHTVEQCHSGLRPGCGAAFSIEVEGKEQLVVVQEVRRNAEELDEIVDCIRQAVAQEHDLSLYAVQLIPVRSIPKTSSGKLMRHACRRGFEEGSLQVVAEWTNEEPAAETDDTEPPKTAVAIGTWLVTRIAAELDASPVEIEVQKPFADYGLDSVQAVNVAGDLEEWLGRTLSPTLLRQYPTIEALAQHLAAPTESTLAANQRPGPEMATNGNVITNGRSVDLKGTNGRSPNSELDTFLRQELTCFLAECPYNTISHLYWAFSDVVVPDHFGCACFWQTVRLARRFQAGAADDVYYLRDRRHVAAVARIDGQSFLLDPYLLHVDPINLSALGHGDAAQARAYPIRRDAEGRQQHSYLEVRRQENELHLMYKQFMPAQNKREVRRFFTLDLDRKIPDDQVAIDARRVAALFFHPEQTTLSLRLVDVESDTLSQIVYPIWRYHGRGDHGPSRLLLMDNQGRMKPAFDDGRPRQEVKWMAEQLATTVDDLVDFILTGVDLYEAHAPEAIDYMVTGEYALEESSV